MKQDSWNDAEQYDRFMGRWSALMADRFLEWLQPSSDLDWLDVGCGTGMLSERIQRTQKPGRLAGVEPSAAYVALAGKRTGRIHDFRTGFADQIPFETDSFDIVVSGLAFNFFPDPVKSLQEIGRVTRPGGMCAAYVWDYAGKMEFLRYFWDAVIDLDPSAGELDEGPRFPICDPKKLQDLFVRSGMQDVKTSYLSIETNFSDFDDFWDPFLSGQGPAPGYVQQMTAASREQLRRNLVKALPVSADGSIRLKARAIAVRGMFKL